MSDGRHSRVLTATAAHGVLMAGALLSVLPFLWMVWISAVPQGEVFSGALLPPASLRALVDNYTSAFTAIPLLRFLFNGAVVCLLIVALQLVIAIPCGYALAKIDFAGRRPLFGAVLVALLIPVQIPAIPLYLVAAKAGLLDTYAGLVFPWITSAFAIFLFRQFFRSFNDEMLDAARLDGFGEWSVVWLIVVPNAWPAVAAFSIFSIVAHWNDLYWPMIAITDPDLMTAPLGIAFFRQAGDAAGNVGALMAAGTVVTAPLALAFLFIQRHVTRGLALHTH